MLTIKYQNAFKKDFKLMKKHGYDIGKLQEILELLVRKQPLPVSYRDHPLVGNYVGCRECHIAPDWLLIYEIQETELILYLLRTGTHSELF